jgi:hypothetical protein
MILSEDSKLRPVWVVKKQSFFLLSAFGGILVFLFSVMTAENLPVILPIVATTGGAFIFAWILWLRQGTINIFEIGILYAAVVSLYTLYPLAGFIINGLSYSPFNDNRLFNARPTPAEIGMIGWYYVIHLFSFLGAYLVIRGRLPNLQFNFQKPQPITVFILIAFYLGISIFFFLTNHIFGISEKSYMQSYLAIIHLPYGIAQLAAVLGGVRFTLQLIILAVLFCNYQKYRLLILGFLGMIFVSTFLHLGGRTELVLLLVGAGLMYYALIRPIPLGLLGLAALCGLVLFIGLGFLRMGWLFSENDPGYNPFAYASEFEVIFGNAYDISQLIKMGSIGHLPAGFLWSDLVIMIPRQFLPFEKISPSEWYVNTFYPAYAELGGGLAFGTISESILGGGLGGLVARGVALGIILAQIHRYYALHRPSFWMFVFYVWLATQIYQSFRNTTFFPLYLFFYRFFWIVVSIKILSAIVKGGVFGNSRRSTRQDQKMKVSSQFQDGIP